VGAHRLAAAPLRPDGAPAAPCAVFVTPSWSRVRRSRERWLGLLPVVAAVAGDPPGAEPWRGAVLARGRALAAALVAGSLADARDAAARLAGLGEGSTPAGDDYLMGVLHALWAGAAPARDWARELAGACAGRTTRASAAWLATAAEGAVGEPWERLLAALARGDDQAVRRAARGVRCLGHTSGAFSLRGFLDASAALGRTPAL
jgi:hypothetical protein